MQPTVRSHWLAIIVLVVVGISAALEFAKVSAVFDAVAEYYGADPSAAAWFVSLPAVMTLLFGLTGSVVAARIGFRRTLMWSLTMAMLFSGVQALLPPVGVFLATRVLDGAVQLGIVIACPVLILQFARPRQRAFAMALWGSFFGCAFALAGWLAPRIVESFGLSAVFAIHAILAAVLVLMIWLWLPRVPGDGPQVEVRAEGFIAAHLEAYRLPRAVLPGLVFVFHTALYAVFVLFVPEFVDPLVQPILLVWMPLVSIFGTIASGFVTGRIASPPVVLVAGYIGVVASMIGIAIWGSHPSLSIALPLTLMVFSGFIQGAAFSLIPVLSTAPDVTARANGVLMQLGNLGTLVGPPLFALAMTSAVDPSPVVFATLTAVLAAAGVAVSLAALRLTGRRAMTA